MTAVVANRVGYLLRSTGPSTRPSTRGNLTCPTNLVFRHKFVSIKATDQAVSAMIKDQVVYVTNKICLQRRTRWSAGPICPITSTSRSECQMRSSSSSYSNQPMTLPHII
uniref:(northern house mosquito) hypothetical protein n=1 Tax=Culex pipiens TaxID=7175 RepID=A0A8D8GX81_CULPI